MPVHSSMPSSPFPKHFPDRVLAWWDCHGRKDLPWQNPREAYRVWISEIMLQQTQVATVIPYFERWMARFPDVEALAEATEDEVLSLWSGLGYYARARNLHEAAKTCAELHGGALPESQAELTDLPGIGRSTANAILSLAFDRPAAVLDGNVKRLLARHAGIDGWPGDGKVQKRLWHEAEARLPAERAADYSQAMMDLGALVCTRSAPACRQCPVSEDCRALALDAIDRMPAPRPKKAVPEKTVHMVVIRDERGRVLLERRPPSGIWGGLWSLPEGASSKHALAKLGFRAGTVPVRVLGQREHRLTHLRLQISCALLTLENCHPATESLNDAPARSWFGPGEWPDLGLPKPVREILEEVA